MDYIKEIRALVGHRPLLLVGAGAIIVRDDEVLLQRRSDNGKWAIHGGCMELHESTEETMLREVYEECGIKPTKYELFNVYSGEDVHNIYPNGDECYFVNVVYLVTEWEGELKKQDSEVTELKWVKVTELPSHEDFHPTDLRLLDEMKVRLKK